MPTPDEIDRRYGRYPRAGLARGLTALAESGTVTVAVRELLHLSAAALTAERRLVPVYACDRCGLLSLKPPPTVAHAEPDATRNPGLVWFCIRCEGTVRYQGQVEIG